MNNLEKEINEMAKHQRIEFDDAVLQLAINACILSKYLQDALDGSGVLSVEELKSLATECETSIDYLIDIPLYQRLENLYNELCRLPNDDGIDKLKEAIDAYQKKMRKENPLIYVNGFGIDRTSDKDFYLIFKDNKLIYQIKKTPNNTLEQVISFYERR